jgi:rare lipoprotein A (peptidoglycan hydrolase)
MRALHQSRCSAGMRRAPQGKETTLGCITRLPAILVLAFALGALPSCASLSVGRASRPDGLASWYGPGFYGQRTASGAVYTGAALTAAHRSLPFGTLVQVTNLDNGRRVVVKIDDRGPFIRGRVIDLSEAAAHRLGMVRNGVAPVRIKVVRWAEGEDSPPSSDMASASIRPLRRLIAQLNPWRGT